MKRIYYALTFFLFFYIQSSGQTQNLKIKSTDVILQGKITDTIFSNKQNKLRKIILTVSKYPFTLIPMVQSKHETYEKEVNFNERFQFVIPAIADNFYVRILYLTGSGESWSTYIDNIYMVQRGDRINCKLSDDYFEFTGKGSEKMNCQSEIYKLRYKVSVLENRLLSNGKEVEFMKLVSRKRDSVLVLQKKVVEKYAKLLSPSMIQIMYLNCYGLRHLEWLRELEMALLVESTGYDFYKGLINSGVYDDINFDLVNKFDEKIIDESYIYVESLLYKITIDQIIYFNNDKSKIIRNELFHEAIFQAIKKYKAGLLRDKLVTLFIVKYQRTEYLNKYLSQAIEMVGSPLYKEIVSEIRTKNLASSPFFPFELEDNYGKIIKLSDFKDKVVFIDFWFTGCIPCMKLKEAMAPVYERYKDNRNVSFISVNTDKDRKQWLASIAGGKYTDIENVNLFTGGLGDSHPIMKYYGMSGGPYIYLLKNGKIYTSPLPRPMLDSITSRPTAEGRTGRLITLIDEALNNEGLRKNNIR